MTRTSNRLLRTALGTVLAACILAGCANTSTDLKPATAAKLQDRLQSLARSAADKDIPAARTQLELLAGDVSTAEAKGELSAGRRQDIQNAMDLVRADLDAMATPAAPAPTPSVATPSPKSPAPPPGGNKGNGKEKGNNQND